MQKAGFSGFVVVLVLASGCRDVDRFSTAPNESYCGRIVAGDIVRTGFKGHECMRLTFDSGHWADRPGTLWTSDGLFAETSLRPIPQLSHDPMLTFSFGEGREKNLLFAVDPADEARGPSLMAVVSLMYTGEVEVRLIRGAKEATATPDPTSPNLPFFGVFSPLRRESGNCSAHPECAWMP